MKSIAFVGMDVHQDFIVVTGVGGSNEKPLFSDRLTNDYEVIKKRFTRLSKVYRLRCCYEASSCGYVLYNWLRGMGIDCEVIAPSLIPHRPGDKIKTDNRDALNLALMYRAGLLTAVHVADAECLRGRSLVRCRESMNKEVTRSRQQILKFLQVRGLIYRDGDNWTKGHWRFLRNLSFTGPEDISYRSYLALLEYKLSQLRELDLQLELLAQTDRYRKGVELLSCFRGIKTTTAMVLLTEIVDFNRFPGAESLMSYVGLVPGQHSSGNSIRTGSITKAGSSRCRRILIESAWHYRHKPAIGARLRASHKGQPADVIATSWKAQQRLYKKYWRIANRKETNIAVTAVARELIGFIWSVMNNN
jgi:transposase